MLLSSVFVAVNIWSKGCLLDLAYQSKVGVANAPRCLLNFLMHFRSCLPNLTIRRFFYTDKSRNIKSSILLPKLFWPTVRKNCSSDREKLSKFLRSLAQFIQTVKGQNNFWSQNAFLTCSLRFLIINKLKQLEFKLEKDIEI